MRIPTVFRTSLLMIALLVCSAGCESLTPQLDAPPVVAPYDVVLGEDYRLPAWVGPESFSGYSDHPHPDEPSSGTALREWWIGWKELEPARGQYDWALVDARLAEAAATGTKLNIHILSVTVDGIGVDDEVPAWIRGEFHLGDDDLVPLGGDFDIRVIPGWREGIRAAFQDLIAAFGARGYPAHENVGAMYIHGISPSLGEEFWLLPETVDTLETEHGLSAAALGEWLTERFQAFAGAFAGHEHKLAWVGRVGSMANIRSDYAAVGLDLQRESMRLGFGNRGGAIELYHVWIDEPSLGWGVDEAGYLTVDESIPLIAEERYFGDENEAYGAPWTHIFGPESGDAQRYRFSMLRALQMRLRFLVTSSGAEAINPPLSRYAGLSFGKSVETSPDAWTYLKESAVHVGVSPTGVIRNFERWLLQRDHPGGMTVPTERVNRGFNAGSIGHGMPGAFYDYAARRTDIDNANPYIYFDLDDRFVVDGPVLVKVEVRDTARTSWHLEYVDDAGVIMATEPYRGFGDGEVRTVSWRLDDAAFVDGLPYGMDLRIACTGPGDVVVRWVRIVRGV